MAAELRPAVEAGDDGSVRQVSRDALRDWCLRRKIETLETDDRPGLNTLRVERVRRSARNPSRLP